MKTKLIILIVIMLVILACGTSEEIVFTAANPVVKEFASEKIG